MRACAATERGAREMPPRLFPPTIGRSPHTALPKPDEEMTRE